MIKVVYFNKDVYDYMGQQNVGEYKGANEVKQRHCLFVKEATLVRLVIAREGGLTSVSSNEVKARACLDSLDK